MLYFIPHHSWAHIKPEARVPSGRPPAPPRHSPPQKGAAGQTEGQTHTRYGLLVPQQKTCLWLLFVSRVRRSLSSHLFEGAGGQPVTRHVDDVVGPRHDVQEALLVHKPCVHGVVVSLRVSTIQILLNTNTHSWVVRVIFLWAAGWRCTP